MNDPLKFLAYFDVIDSNIFSSRDSLSITRKWYQTECAIWILIPRSWWVSPFYDAAQCVLSGQNRLALVLYDSEEKSNPKPPLWQKFAIKVTDFAWKFRRKSTKNRISSEKQPIWGALFELFQNLITNKFWAPKKHRTHCALLLRLKGSASLKI